MISMQRTRDCGPVAIANYLEYIGHREAKETYNAILKEFGFPKSDGLVADLWDSPLRHFDIIEKITGRRPGLVSAGKYPAVILLKFSTTSYHWITAFSSDSWHDGQIVRTGTWETKWGPVGKHVLSYSLESAIPLPWYWQVWYRFTMLFT